MLKPNEHGAIIINPTPTVSILKYKGERPSVIEYGGRRYIHDPGTVARGGKRGSGQSK